MRLRLTLIILSMLALAPLVSAQERPRNRYLIPEGYKGWVLVEYGVPGARELKKEDEFRLIEIPKNGWVTTSTEFIEGASLPDEYFFVKGSQRTPISRGFKTGLINKKGNGIFSCPGKSYEHSQNNHFYVGPYEEAIKAWWDPCLFIKDR